MKVLSRTAALVVLGFVFSRGAWAASVSGRLTDLQNEPVAAAKLRIANFETTTDAGGRFRFATIPPGQYRLKVDAPGFAAMVRTVNVADTAPVVFDLQFTSLASRTDAVTVTADVAKVGIDHPDPAQQINVREDILDANPGRPGAPVSIPGVPAETASSGIKAPQYFAPGVAGDHGEPIAQYLQAGSYLIPNNLSANAHGNGYADPNVMVPAIIETVQTDGGAFNVREGNHSVNLAAVYGFRDHLEPFATVTGDYRDADVVAGFGWLALQASFGNGFLDTLEHRQQYKFNALHSFDFGNHHLTLFGIGYYGVSKIPGLVPIELPNLHDTLDPRQREQTHTGEIAVNEVWHVTPTSELQVSSFFRTYNLSLTSNFGDGLIRQSEFRTVTGGNGTYVRKFNRYLSLMSGLDYLRDAPRRLNLDRYESSDTSYYGPFQKVTSNDVTLNLVSPYVAIDGGPTSWLHYNLGWRRDQIGIENADLLNPSNSFQRWVGVNSPKATVGLLPPEKVWLPSVAMSFGQTFFTNDPRIGTGSAAGTPVSRAHAYQIVVSKMVWNTDVRVTLGRVTQEASLAKIDPDSGLQYDEGPGRNRYITVTARRYFHGGSIQAVVSKADARDLSGGTPIPEAPRLIVDLLGTLEHLPFKLQARAEFEQVGRKPLGDGFVSVPVREFRGALVRQFGDRLQVGVNFLIASGYTGQTTEVLALPGEADASERVVGVYLPSYATVSVRYRFGREKARQ